MPWRKFAQFWNEALTQTQDGVVSGVCQSDGNLLVEVREPLRQREKVKVKLPCGERLVARALWQRPNSNERVLAALELPDEKLAIEPEASCRATTRQLSRRVMRFWVTFADPEVHGTVSYDLSPEGLGLVGDYTDQVGRDLDCYLDLPSTVEPVKVQLRLIWADGERAGGRFINLRSCEEVRILRALGTESVEPSKFLPDFELDTAPFTYQFAELAPGWGELRLSLCNWEFKFLFESPEVKGGLRGAFRRSEVADTGREILRKLREKKISLERRQDLLHLRLFNERDELVFELVGEEKGFQRCSRREMIYQSEVA